MSQPADGLALTQEHRNIVLGILNAHLPADARVYVFGSRAKGRVRPYSDLDLAIDAGRKLSLDERAALAEAFDESDLPWKVDIVDSHAIGAAFRQEVERERVALK